MPIFRPAWFEALDLRDKDDVLIRNRYLIRAAALTNSPTGSLVDLARDSGVSRATLLAAYMAHRGVITPMTAIALEQCLGRDVLPRKLVRPDIF